MFHVPLITASNTLTVEQFWKSIFLYHASPHLINRRLLGIKQLYLLRIKFKDDSYKLKNIFTYSELQSHFRRHVPFSLESINKNIILNILELNTRNFECDEIQLDDLENEEDGMFISVRLLLSRISRIKNCVEIVAFEKTNKIITFSSISETDDTNLCPNFSYDVELEQNKYLKICIDDIELAESKSSDWLVDKLFSKLLSWAEQADENKQVNKSLRLIPVEEYYEVYNRLKEKYGEKMLKIWPENTDPKKFVYEDLAIATYLLLLWKRTEQRFVDLGCGNGLLVYILNEEGHHGYGIDVRPRKIWKFYPENILLKVETLIPSSSTVYPDVDWIIGNHSDELTPWIPVMAARSSSTCKFFLLPCCAYEFTGKKYQRVNAAVSQYSEYLDYVKDIVEVCGFTCEMDKLRIPSTKRTCLIGRMRLYSDEIDENITDFINKRCNKNNNDWVDDYTARDAVEAVRNCTRVDRKICEKIVRLVVDKLLSMKNYVNDWNAGGSIHLADLVKLIDANDLKGLKSECGGLQTLLRNNHYVFRVKNGVVQIRVPVFDEDKIKRKSKPCWFFDNHPDGCYLSDENCSYLHNKE